MHPSLIPFFCGVGYYGLKVHEAALARGVKITGATVHFVDEGTDSGPIILQKAVEVLEGDTPESLQKRVMEQAEWILLPQAVQALCEELGLKNISKTITAEEFFDILPTIQYYADEPNANLSTVPLYFLSKLAAQDVKVVLSGEGSDELFGGYITYHTTKPYRAYRKLPLPIRKAVAGVVSKLPPFHGQGFLTKAAKLSLIHI